MWTMARSAVILFFRGQLFAEPGKAYALILANVVFTALLCLALVTYGLPLWGAALLAGFIGGGLQPILFKNIRFR
jgi:hypothetical protein